MRKILLAAMLAATVVVASAATTPIYLDESRPIEERVDDFVGRCGTAWHPYVLDR